MATHVLHPYAQECLRSTRNAVPKNAPKIMAKAILEYIASRARVHTPEVQAVHMAAALLLVCCALRVCEKRPARTCCCYGYTHDAGNAERSMAIYDREKEHSTEEGREVQGVGRGGKAGRQAGRKGRRRRERGKRKRRMSVSSPSTSTSTQTPVPLS